jgi:hypothetical protein
LRRTEDPGADPKRAERRQAGAQLERHGVLKSSFVRAGKFMVMDTTASPYTLPLNPYAVSAWV